MYVKLLYVENNENGALWGPEKEFLAILTLKLSLVTVK